MTFGGHTGYIGWGNCKDPAYRALILARDPYAWWPADDAAGSLHDEMPGNHDAGPSGSGSGITYRVDGPMGAPCSYAVDLGGEFFNTGISALSNTQHYAVLLNFRVDAYTADTSIFGTWNDGEGFMMYMPTTSGELRQYHGSTFYNTGYTPPVGEWVNLLFGWNGSHVKSWAAGSSILSTANASGHSPTGTSTAPYIGTYNNRSISIFNGDLQHIALFLDGDADAILNDTDAALLAAAAMGA